MAGDIIVETKVSAATVFTDRARVVRTGRSEVAGGQSRLMVVDLPVELDPKSVRVSLRSERSATLLGVDVRQTFHERPSAEKVRSLEDQLQLLMDADSVDSDAVDRCTQALKHIDGIADSGRDFARSLARGQCKIGDLAELQRFMRERKESIQQELRLLATQKRLRHLEITRVRQEIEQLAQVQATTRKCVAVDLRMDVGAEVELDVTYVIRNAGWNPIYDARYTDGRITLSYLAEVQQKTGEDWAGIALTLSTARPSVATKIPRLKAWNLHAHQANYDMLADAMPATKAGTIARSAKAIAVQAAIAHTMPRASKEMPAEAAHETAKVESTGAAVSFQIPSSVDVPSDDSPHKVTVGVFDLTPNLDYVAVPKMADGVFRRAKATNASQSPILPGKAQLFVDGEFFGATELGLVAPKAQFELHLGVDDRIRAERTQTKRDFSKSIMGGRKRIQFGYVIELENHTDKPQEMTIVDGIPRPQHEDIKVTLDHVDPKPDRQDDLNVVVWKLKLDPGAKRKIQYEFTVDHPRDMPVSGLGEQ